MLSSKDVPCFFGCVDAELAQRTSPNKCLLPSQWLHRVTSLFHNVSEMTVKQRYLPSTQVQANSRPNSHKTCRYTTAVENQSYYSKKFCPIIGLYLKCFSHIADDVLSVYTSKPGKLKVPTFRLSALFFYSTFQRLYLSPTMGTCHAQTAPL